jgi:excinuclease UvrABC helicase subunit UvrB
MNNILNDINNMQENLINLASCSEFEERRQKYLSFNEEINVMAEEIKKDLDDNLNYETYTGSLDRF